MSLWGSQRGRLHSMSPHGLPSLLAALTSLSSQHKVLSLSLDPSASQCAPPGLKSFCLNGINPQSRHVAASLLRVRLRRMLCPPPRG